jgi:sporulation protein YlmC with PRC-barrel domain
MTAERLRHANIRASNVSGTRVYSASGEHLGHIDDLVIGKRDGRVKYVIMSFGGFLGIGEEFHPLPWDRLQYDEKRRGYVIALTRKDLEEAPRYPRGSEPDWDDDEWGRRIYDYYGVAPFFTPGCQVPDEEE